MKSNNRNRISSSNDFGNIRNKNKNAEHKEKNLLSMYLPNPFLKVNFLAEYSWFEFRVYLLLDQLPCQG